MLNDPRLSRNNVRVPRRDNYQNRPVLSATIHPDLKRTLVAMSERTGMSVSQVTDEVLYTGLIEMQEMWGGGGEQIGPSHSVHKVVSLIFAYMPPLILHSLTTLHKPILVKYTSTPTRNIVENLVAFW